MKQRRALGAVAMVCAAHGVVSGSFATRVPWISSHLELSAGSLGLALLAPALGALVVTPLAPRLVAAWGGRRTTRTAALAYTLSLMTPAFAPNLAVLWVTLLGMGVAAGVCDVAMKSQGHALETRVGRPVMSKLYGAWSVGTLAGAAIGTVATLSGVDARLHLVWVALGLAVLAASASVALPASPPPARRAAEPRTRATLPRPSRMLVAVVAVAFCATFAEASAHTWSAQYIADVTKSGPTVSCFGFAAFVAAMATGRLSGDVLMRRFGGPRLVQTGGLLAVAGGALVVLARTPLPGMVGFAVLGLGIAVVMPVALGAGAEAGSSASQGITAVLGCVQLAAMVAPGAIGAVGSLVSLPVAFAAVVAATVPVVLLATAMRPQPTVEAEPVAAAEPVTYAVGRVVLDGPVMGEQLDPTLEMPAFTRGEEALAAA
ncbi:MAG TPA: MFS transporter [Stackebrandtia sp.]|jgi:MFS family permease|uniref:MFS transporter n=1 Tax=Stackebrandtia sp. TaxID=2023065 RepID=UPI002D59D6E4|nr:MFS transporter [Stackebrandtia sp.]HZE40173.1 MFS transporter [Stackebrandtia sp.]